MSMFTCLITLDDLALYMGKTVSDLPKGTDALIKRASENVLMAIKNNYDPLNSEHLEAAKLATCAQSQFWIESELSAVSNGNISSYSLGELSITYSDVDKLTNKLCLLSVRYLNYKHLLYKGVG